MRRKLFLVALALLVALPLVAQEMTVDQVIAKNIEARGGMAKLKAVNTKKVTGKFMVGPGIEAPVVIYMRRPNDMRMEFTLQGLTAVQAYDGQSGWAIMPFQGKKDPEPMTGDDVKEFAEQADIDGALVDYASKGHKVELLGKDKVEGSDAYKLKLTRKNGDVETIFIDADSFLEVRSESRRNMRGTDVETEASLGDYKEVDGLVLPFTFDNGIKGRPERKKITIEKYEINVPLERALFVMPEIPEKKAGDKPKTEEKPKN